MKFIKHYFSSLLNIMCFASMLLFAVSLLSSGYKRDDSTLSVLSLIPILVLGYNTITDYNAYKKNGFSAQKLAYLFFGACLLVILAVIGMFIF